MGTEAASRGNAQFDCAHSRRARLRRLLVASAVMGVVAWSRHRYSPRVRGGGRTHVRDSIASGLNNWPTVLNALDTSQPFQLQVAGLVGIGLAP
jgi:hypothetical protein